MSFAVRLPFEAQNIRATQLPGDLLYYNLMTGKPDSTDHVGHDASAYDFGLPLGTNLIAIGTGTVVSYHNVVPNGEDAGTSWASSDPYGNFVTIKYDMGDGNNLYATYCHLELNSGIAVNTVVHEGDHVGNVGLTGDTYGPHLHIQFGLGTITPTGGGLKADAAGDYDIVTFGDPTSFIYSSTYNEDEYTYSSATTLADQLHAQAISLSGGSYSTTGSVGAGYGTANWDSDDFYSFVAPSDGTVNVTLSGLSHDIDLRMLNGNGQRINQSINNGTTNENIIQSVTAGQTYLIHVDPYHYDSSSYSLNMSFAGTGTVCFLKGTSIATPAGEMPVESIREGDIVLTASGARRPVKWVGNGRILATRGTRNAATPVIIRKDALADGVPSRDLRVTKGHSLFLDGALIPVEFLVNYRTILWDDHAQEVSLYHIELDSHDVLIANGAPAESYRDDGNRWLFRNASSGWGLPPQEPYAPVLTGGPLVDTVWRRLLGRAGQCPGLPLTNDPDLHLLADGRRIDAASVHGASYIFCLPSDFTSVRIVSRSGVPSELGVARDPRELGVALRKVAIRQDTRFRVLEADNPVLADGFHEFEPADNLRWTDGDAGIPAALLEGFLGLGPVEIVLYVGCTSRYQLTGEEQRALAA